MATEQSLRKHGI